MQSANDVEFRDCLGVARRGRFKSFFQRHGVGAGSVLLAAESTQPASRHANIGGIQMAVDVEVCLVAMHAFADVVGHPAYGQNIAGTVESKSVIGIQSIASHNLVMDWAQPGVISLE